MTDDEFARLYDRDAATLAELFDVPLDAIADKRTDLIVGAAGSEGAPCSFPTRLG
jgi:hypothetical protein